MSVSQLTKEQLLKIEENKKQALARRAEKSIVFAKNESAGRLQTLPSSSNKSDFESRLTALEKRHVPLSSQPQRNNIPPSSATWKSNAAKSSKPYQPSSSSSSNSKIRPQTPGAKHSSSTSSSALGFYGKIQQLKGKCVLMNSHTFCVEVGYHSALIEFFKQQKTRSYDAVKKIWCFKLEEYDTIMKGLNAFRPDVEIEGFPRHILEAFGPRESSNSPVPEADLSSVPAGLVNTLKAFQREGVNVMIHRKGRMLLADDMGLGKTLQAICVAAFYRKEWPLLVVAPSSVRFDWAQQICKWLPDVSREDVNVVESSKSSGTSGLVNIISYDLLSKKSQEFKHQNFQVVIMDESHFLKNFKTVRTKAAMPLLRGAKRVLLLSGTPALSRPVELYCQISAVCPYKISFHDFGLRYCAAKQLPWGWDYNGSSNMVELQIFLEKCVMLRRQKKDVLSQLPSKTRQMVVLDPASVQKHKDLKKAFKIMDKAKDKGAEKRGALLRYFQETGRAKLAAVREYVLDLLESDKKFLVFAHHREMLDSIEDCIKSQASKAKYMRIDGSTTSEQRSFFCKKFQTDEAYKVAVLSITAANAGLNLAAANIVVFAELFWNPGILVQAEDRAHRMGQKDSVSVQYLVAPGTADDEIWPLIQGKLDVLGQAGLTKDDFSDADTRILADPSQSTILDLFNTESDAYVSLPQTTCSNSAPHVEQEPGKNVNKAFKASPTKRQASITNFVTSTAPSKKVRCSNEALDRPNEWPDEEHIEIASLEEDQDGSALTNDDLAAMASFDWDDPI